MEKRLTMFFACLFLSLGMALAQTKVTGTVISQDDNEPVIGASVLVVGTQVGTVTDTNGRFSLTVPAGKSTLRITYVGMEPIEVSARPNMRIMLTSDQKALDEVIVVAYGTAKKTSFTGSAESVSADKLELRPITSATKALEGNVSGVLMTSGTGQPGNGASIRIRGFGSINASNDPLYVVDGIPFDGNINSINPADIESMTVLKDASAGALYGARGANGVVMITTKKGKEGRVSVTWRSNIGWSNRALKKYDNVSPTEYTQLLYESLRNDYVYNQGYAWEDAEVAARGSMSSKMGGELYNPFKNYTWDTIINPVTGQVQSDATMAWNENWMDAVTRNNAFRHEHQLSISGGSAKTQWLTSLGYLNEDGILKTTSFQRYNARVNVNTEVTDWFSSNLNVSLAHTITNYSNYEDTANSNVWYTAQFANPLFPMYYKNLDGSNLLDANGNPQLDYGDKGRPGSLKDFNVLGGLVDDAADYKRDIASIRTGMVFGGDSERFGVFKGLKLAFNFGLDYRSQDSMDYMNMHHGNQAKQGGRLTKEHSRTTSYTFNQLLTWTRSFDQHNFDVLFGHEFYELKYSYMAAAKTNLVDGILELRPGTTLQEADSYSQLYRVNSWLGRFNYNYADRYYFSASLRSDASSRFYVDNNKGTFWSLGASWRMSQENFMKNIKWIDNMTFKISYGEQGNDNLGTYYAWQSLYNLSYSNADQVGGVIASLETKDLSWEKNGNLNIGLEGSFLNNRIKASIEFYTRKTTNMLLSYPMATSTGFDGYNANVGDMRNSGWEFTVTGTPIQTKDLRWNITWMGATTKNKVLKLTAETPEIIKGIYSIKEGQELNTFYMAKSAGVDPSNGQQLYWAFETDEEGNKIEGTEYVTSDRTKALSSKYYLGSRIPTLYGSISTDLTFKGFDLSVLTTYSIGGKVYDSLYSGSMNVLYVNNTWNRNALRRWQQPGDVTDVPRIELGGTSIPTDRYLIDASYFAIKNITLGYTFPRHWMSKVGITGLRVYTSVDNLALFTHLDGMDPQYNFSGSNNYTYATNKTWSFGLEVKF